MQAFAGGNKGSNLCAIGSIDKGNTVADQAKHRAARGAESPGNHPVRFGRPRLNEVHIRARRFSLWAVGSVGAR